MGGAMDNLMGGSSNNSNQDHARRSSTPGGSSGTTSGGFNSIFKSVINAATKTTTAPSASNFYVAPLPVAPEPIAIDSHSQPHVAPPQKSVQGIVGRFSVFGLDCFGFVAFLFVFWWNIVLITDDLGGEFLVLFTQSGQPWFTWWMITVVCVVSIDAPRLDV